MRICTQSFDDLIARGGQPLRLMTRAHGGGPYLTPGLIDMTGVSAPDEEVFGPLLQVVRVADFDAAIAAANDTRFGLSAGLIGGDAELWDHFREQVRAGKRPHIKLKIFAVGEIQRVRLMGMAIQLHTRDYGQAGARSPQREPTGSTEQINRFDVGHALLFCCFYWLRM